MNTCTSKTIEKLGPIDLGTLASDPVGDCVISWPQPCFLNSQDTIRSFHPPTPHYMQCVSVVYSSLYHSLQPPFACVNLIPSSSRTDTEREREGEDQGLSAKWSCQPQSSALSLFTGSSNCLQLMPTMQSSPFFSLRLFSSFSRGNSCFF